MHVAGERHAPRNRVLVLFSFQLLAALSQLLGGSLACIDSGPVQWPSSGLEWALPACLPGSGPRVGALTTCLTKLRPLHPAVPHWPRQRPPLRAPKVNNRPSSPSPRLHLTALSLPCMQGIFSLGRTKPLPRDLASEPDDILDSHFSTGTDGCRRVTRPRFRGSLFTRGRGSPWWSRKT